MSTEMFGVFKALTTALITPFSILLTIVGAFFSLEVLYHLF